jgi:hypothetical protein
MTEASLKAFHPVNNWIGLIVFIGEKVTRTEFLSGIETLKKNHPKLVHGSVMGAQ